MTTRKFPPYPLEELFEYRNYKLLNCVPLPISVCGHFEAATAKMKQFLWSSSPLHGAYYRSWTRCLAPGVETLQEIAQHRSLQEWMMGGLEKHSMGNGICESLLAIVTMILYPSIFVSLLYLLANTCVVSWRWCLQKEEISTSHSLSQSYLAMVLLWELWTANGFFTPRRAWVCISSLGGAAAAAVGTTTAHVICRYYTRCVINKTNGIRIKRGCISSRLLIINSYFHGHITINLMWNEVQQQQQHKICITLPYIHIHGKCISSAHPIFAR